MSARKDILFYNADTQSGVTTEIDKTGNLITLTEFPAGSFGVWTHIVSDGSRLLFYNADTQSGVTTEIDKTGNLITLTEFPAGSFGVWTHIVS
ncbi:MAG: hypothetical protein H0W96_10800 [Solirubrobacterales bacterium]|nr:hypothetical protein [Solirubrobacterales bacterium]